MKKVVRASNGRMVSVPSNWKEYFQSFDLAVNKSSKDFLHNEAQSCYSQAIVKQMESGRRPDQIKVDVRISVEKPLQAQWIIKYYDYARNKSELIMNRW